MSKLIKKPANKTRLTFGIDPSLTGFAIASLFEGDLHHAVGWTDKVTLQQKNPTELCWFKSPRSTPASRQSRIAIVSDWCLSYIDETITELGGEYQLDVCVAFEGYAFSQHSVGNSDIHEVCGVVKTNLWKQAIPMRTYTPNEVKLAFAGHGFASKEDMIVACYNHYGVDYSRLGSAADNLADAVGIAHLLDIERRLRLELTTKEELSEEERRVLHRTTKAQPDPLVYRPFIHRAEVEHNDPIFSEDRK